MTRSRALGSNKEYDFADLAHNFLDCNARMRLEFYKVRDIVMHNALNIVPLHVSFKHRPIWVEAQILLKKSQRWAMLFYGSHDLTTNNQFSMISYDLNPEGSDQKKPKIPMCNRLPMHLSSELLKMHNQFKLWSQLLVIMFLTVTSAISR